MQTIPIKVARLVGSAVILFGTAAALAYDWPEWRGPRRDGIVRGVAVPVQWPKTLKEEWHALVGEAYASPVVVGDKVYVFTRQNEHEVAHCVALATGKVIWQAEPYPAPYKPGPAAPGDTKPRATPTVAGGRVFTMGVSEVLSCFDAATGKLLWRKDSTGYPVYGASASPLVLDDTCIAQLGKGGLTAFDVATGEVKWRCDDVLHGPGYGSPILAELAGTRQLVTVTQSHFLAAAPDTGKLLWRLPIMRWDLQQCITPVVYKDLIIYAETGETLRANRLDKSDQGLTAKEVWRAKGDTSSGYQMSPPVLSGDWLLGFSSQKLGHLFCLDARTGQTLWQSEGRLGGRPADAAAILLAGNVWLALTNRGHLIVLKASGTAYEPIAEYSVADQRTDGQPVLLGERILIRDQTTLRCLRIGTES